MQCQLRLGHTVQRHVIDTGVDDGVGAGIGVIEHVLDRPVTEAPQVEQVADSL